MLLLFFQNKIQILPMHFSKWGANRDEATGRSQFGHTQSTAFFVFVDPNTSISGISTMPNLKMFSTKKLNIDPKWFEWLWPLIGKITLLNLLLRLPVQRRDQFCVNNAAQIQLPLLFPPLMNYTGNWLHVLHLSDHTYIAWNRPAAPFHSYIQLVNLNSHSFSIVSFNFLHLYRSLSFHFSFCGILNILAKLLNLFTFLL